MDEMLTTTSIHQLEFSFDNSEVQTPSSSIHSFFSRSETLEILESFGSPAFDATMALLTLKSDDLIGIMKRMFNNDCTQQQQQSPDIPMSFIESVIQVVSDDMTIQSLDDLIKERVVENHEFHYFEKILLLRLAFLRKSLREHQRHIDALRMKEMDLAATELGEQERRLIDLVERLHDRDELVENITAENRELKHKLQQMDQVNFTMNDELSSMKRMMLEEQERYMDLLQEHELEKVQGQQQIQQLQTQLQEQIQRIEHKDIELKECQLAIEQLTKSKEKMENSNRKMKQTIEELRRREMLNQQQQQQQVTMEKNSEMRSGQSAWYGQQIIALEADRDLYFQQVIQLQEELKLLTRDFDQCIRKKDVVINEIQNRLHNAQSLVRESIHVRSENSCPKERESYLSRLQRELQELEYENKQIIMRLDGELKDLKFRIDTANSRTEEQVRTQQPNCDPGAVLVSAIENDEGNVLFSNSAIDSSAIGFMSREVQNRVEPNPPGSLCTSFEELVARDIEHGNTSETSVQTDDSKVETVDCECQTEGDDVQQLATYRERIIKLKREVLRLKKREEMDIAVHLDKELLQTENERLKVYERKYHAIMKKYNERKRFLHSSVASSITGEEELEDQEGDSFMSMNSAVTDSLVNNNNTNNNIQYEVTITKRELNKLQHLKQPEKTKQLGVRSVSVYEDQEGMYGSNPLLSATSRMKQSATHTTTTTSNRTPLSLIRSMNNL